MISLFERYSIAPILIIEVGFLEVLSSPETRVLPTPPTPPSLTASPSLQIQCLVIGGLFL